MFYRLYWPIAAVDVRLCSLDPLHKRKTTGREKEKWTDFDVADTQPFVELGILGVISFFVLHIRFQNCSLSFIRTVRSVLSVKRLQKSNVLYPFYAPLYSNL